MVSYLITDPLFYTDNPEQFSSIFKHSLLENTPTHACFRDKVSLNPEVCYPHFVSLCHQNGVVSLLNGSPIEAAKWGFQGVHIRSLEYHLIAQGLALGLNVVASCHTLEDVEYVRSLNVTMATLSPIWESPNKGTPLGLERLNEICDKIELPIIALGGVMTQAQIDAVVAHGAAGFASIRYFLNNG
jgi:thiamine-phosphate pyrophosphorylase